MRYSVISALAAATAVNAGGCSNPTNEGGNYFCSAVKQIKYGGLDIAGSYRAVSHMDNTGACTFEDKNYSGPIAPFDEELSLHLRGPLKLDAFAVYKPKAQAKRDTHSRSHAKRHRHQHLHKKHHEEEKRGADEVVATINGEVVSWVNNYFGGNGGAAAATGYPTADAPAATDAPSSPAATTPAPSAPVSSYPEDDDVIVPEGDFGRVAYYNATTKDADGLTFLANKGDPSMSGTWDTVWGNSLSYVSSDGKSCAASPNVLGDVVIGDGDEIAIYSDKKCTGSSCGAVRPESVAYHGWEGATKVFLMEFSMPMTGATGWNKDMPAAWLLNAAVARTGQYSSCSCWKGDNASPTAGGCGEADIFEVLASGDTKCKSTFHFAKSLGDSHYFDRPVNKAVKVAVVFQASSSTATIKVIDDATSFSAVMASDLINDMVKDETEMDLFSLMDFAAGF